METSSEKLDLNTRQGINWERAQALVERERLAADLVGVLRRLTMLQREAGDLESAIDAASRAVRLNALDEADQRALMQLYAAAGQPMVALRQYRDYEALVAEQLQTTPSVEMQAVADCWRTEAKGAPLAVRTSKV